MNFEILINSKARLFAKGSNLLVFRSTLSEDVPLLDSAKVEAEGADLVFVYSILKHVFIVLLNLSLQEQISVDIDFGTKQEVKVIGKPERIQAIDSTTARTISTQNPKSSLFNQKAASLFFELVTVSDNKIKLPYDKDLTIKGNQVAKL